MATYYLDEKAWEETYEYLRLTFSPSGALLAAAYEKTKSEYFLSGDMAIVPEIHRPDDAQEFSKKKELLAAMEDFFSRNKASEEDESSEDEEIVEDEVPAEEEVADEEVVVASEADFTNIAFFTLTLKTLKSYKVC